MQKTDARHSTASGESKLHFLDYWRVIRVRFGIVLLSFLLVVITAAITTYFQPRKYISMTTLELRMDVDENRIFQQTNANGIPGTDPRFLPTQNEIIKSTNVLYPVIESEKLVQAWAVDGNPITKEMAYNKLRSMLDLKEIRGTELLQLQVTSTDPKEATRLVNAVTTAYQDARRKKSQDLIQTSDPAIDQHVQELRQRVNDLEAKITDFQQKNPLVRHRGTDGHNAEDPYQGEVDQQQAEVARLTSERDHLKNQLEQVTKLKGDELMRALALLNITDPTVAQVLPKYQEAKSNEASMLNSGVGERHPAIKALRAALAEYSNQLTAATDTIRHSLAIQLQIVETTLATLTKHLEELRTEQRQNRVAGLELDRLNDDYTQAKALFTEADQKASQHHVDTRMPTIPAYTWSPAEVPTSPSSPKVPLNMAIGVLAGLIVGVGLAFFIEYLDTSVKTMDDVETVLGVPVLAIVPKNIRLLHKQPTDVLDAEAYRILRTNIEFNRKSADANTISMVSGGPGEGKSTTLCNLAFTCAQGGYSVLIVDADLRRPTRHKLFEVNNSVGLTNYLTTNIPLEDVIVSTSVENLSLMPSGILPADAVGILNSQRMSDMIAELKTRYDIVFFDSPPILGVSDGAVLASEVDQSIIIVQHRRFPRAMLVRVKQAINNVGGTVLGVVLNNVDLRHDPNYAYYTSYYEYYAVRTPKESPATSATAGGKRAAAAGTARNGQGNSTSSEY